MNNEKVYIEGYIVGVFKETTLEKIGNRIQLANGEIVDIDYRFIHKSINPEKVKIPQYIAEKIEYFKKTGDWDLFQAMDDLFEHTKTCKWLEVKDNQETFAQAWIFGYEVEKEKRYLVKIKNLNTLFCYLAHSDHGDYWSITYSKINGLSTKHTRKELEEAGFGWVFDCEGIEVEEVQE